MSKPVFEDLFRFRGARRNRKSYILYGIAFGLLGGVTDLIVSSAEDALVVIGALVYLAIAISGIAVTTQRFRDLGWSGWSVLVVPGLILLIVIAFSSDWGASLAWLMIAGVIVVQLALVCVPGNRGDNRYGVDPREFG